MTKIKRVKSRTLHAEGNSLRTFDEVLNEIRKIASMEDVNNAEVIRITIARFYKVSPETSTRPEWKYTIDAIHEASEYDINA